VIPPFDPASGNLPPGTHNATWSDIVARYGSTPQRLWLLAGLKSALDALRRAGCAHAYIDGSFVTNKPTPNDVDACWDPAGVDFGLLDRLEPALLDWSGRRAAQKAKFGGELFVASMVAGPSGVTFLDFFQHDRQTGVPKGIIAIDLGGLP